MNISGHDRYGGNFSSFRMKPLSIGVTKNGVVLHIGDGTEDGNYCRIEKSTIEELRMLAELATQAADQEEERSS